MSSLPLSVTALPLRPSTLSNTSNGSTLETIPSSARPQLHCSDDARQFVRLLQCSQCSYPLREPVTLPCGNSICKKCIPELHVRPNISYPATANRLLGFSCPFLSCNREHAQGDCNANVVLNKIMESVKKAIDGLRNEAEASKMLIQIEEKDKWSIAGVSSLQDGKPHVRVLAGGRLAATYTMAEMGELAYDSEATYTIMADNAVGSGVRDTAAFELLTASTRTDLDCQVCFGLFLDPLTTACGHTFCRTCLHRILDHSTLCPICRRVLETPRGISAQQAPSNDLLTKLISGLYPDALAAREEAAKADDQGGVGELDTPLFICTLSFPRMPTFLHIFEPRYRLMIRRAMETGDRKFGMLLHNPTYAVQGDLGSVPFYQYGTLLHIVQMELLPDGRSLIETVGASRFRVTRYGSLDGYTVGKIERVDDISLAAEEALEASETSPEPDRHMSAEDQFAPPPNHNVSREGRRAPPVHDLDTMSTKDIMEIGLGFVKRMRDQSAPWLHTKIFQAYGECPEDPALFPWWFASVLPLRDGEKYSLLSTTSVRERLKICAVWIARIEAQTRRSGVKTPAPAPSPAVPSSD